MSIKNQHAGVIEICDLEYEVAGVGATESSPSEENQAAIFIVLCRLPENN